MNPILVTSMNDRIMREYGQKMVNGFLKFWPDIFTLHVYCEDECMDSLPGGRVRAFNLYECQPGLKAFVDRNPQARGKTPYVYKWDACKFAHKSFAIIDALENGNGRRVYWLDADVQTLQQIDADRIWHLVRGYYSAYLGRRNFHTETGFLAFDTSMRAANESFVMAFKDYYESDKVLDLPEWHDCAVYDACRAKWPALFRNLTPSAVGTDHVFNKYWLPVMSHHKGPQRKKLWENGKERHI